MPRKQYAILHVEEEVAEEFRDLLSRINNNGTKISQSTLLLELIERRRRELPREGILEFYAKRRVIIKDGVMKVV